MAIKIFEYPEEKKFGSSPELDEIIKGKDIRAIMELIEKEQYGLDYLKDDALFREAIIRQGYFIDEIAQAPDIDEDPWVKVAILEYGDTKKYQELYKDDPSEDVRMAVVESGYNPDYYQNDVSPLVRSAVARATKDETVMNKLAYDESGIVTAALAGAGRCLDVLVKSEDPNTRYEVARRGYGIDILIKDEAFLPDLYELGEEDTVRVCDGAKAFLEELDITFADYMDKKDEYYKEAFVSSSGIDSFVVDNSELFQEEKETERNAPGDEAI